MDSPKAPWCRGTARGKSHEGIQSRRSASTEDSIRVIGPHRSSHRQTTVPLLRKCLQNRLHFVASTTMGAPCWTPPTISRTAIEHPSGLSSTAVCALPPNYGSERDFKAMTYFMCTSGRTNQNQGIRTPSVRVPSGCTTPRTYRSWT